MDARKIISYWRRGKFLVIVDDKQDLPVTPAYLEQNIVMIAPSLDYATDMCVRFQQKERERTGKAMTRYKVSSSALPEDYAVSEDLTEDQVYEIIDDPEFPLPEEDKATAKKHLRRAQEKLGNP